MTDNFRGVLIFVVDVAVTKFPPTKINASTVTHASVNGSYKSEGSGLKHHGSVADCTSVLDNSNCHCYPADGVFNSNGLVALAICCRSGKEIERGPTVPN